MSIPLFSCKENVSGYTVFAFIWAQWNAQATRTRLLTEVHLIINIDANVLLENRTLIKCIRNYIRNRSGVFSISYLVRITMTSFRAIVLLPNGVKRHGAKI